MINSKIESAASSLIEDLKSTDTKTKINAIKSLTVVSLTLGKERTRNELLPYIEGIIYFIYKYFLFNFDRFIRRRR
jgi:hypothetical protein